MSDSLGPGATFAGCRIETVAARGGMGVVFRATQLALRRPVALKAIAPELAADDGFRERFQRESQLTASLDHPNVIPVYEAGELDGTLYLIMRWVEGTDLRTRLTSGPVGPAHAIRLLLPVASALAAAHRRGLVHRDVKPANVMIARGDEDTAEHVYLTDFGIARQAEGASLTRTGMFVGTLDYSAPERIQGGRGDASSDIYSLGCVLFETLTGHAPYGRESNVAKVYAHMYEQIPSPRSDVGGVPEQLDLIVTKAMAKRPDERFASAHELAVALGVALQDLETGERAAAKRPASETEPASPENWLDAREPQLAAPETELAVPDTRPAAPETRPAVAAHVAQPAAPKTQPAVPIAKPSPTEPPEDSVSAARQRRRPRVLWLIPVAVITVAGVLVAVLGGSDKHPAPTAVTSAETAAPSSSVTAIKGGGMTQGPTISLMSQPGGISVGPTDVWVSAPERGELIRLNPVTQGPRTVATAGRPTVLAAGASALWVGDEASQSLVEFNGDSGAQVAHARLNASPTAVAVDRRDSSAWVADSSGAITHVALGGGTVGVAARIGPAASDLAWGEGWLWAVNGANDGLVRVSLGTGGSPTTFAAGPGPVAVTLDQGVWTAHLNGHVTRFDPRLNHLRVNADLAIAPELDGIAAVDSGPFVWAISQQAQTLYRISNTSTPALTGTVSLASAPLSLAADAHSVWVATLDGKVTQVRF